MTTHARVASIVSCAWLSCTAEAISITGSTENMPKLMRKEAKRTIVDGAVAAQAVPELHYAAELMQHTDLTEDTERQQVAGRRRRGHRRRQQVAQQHRRRRTVNFWFGGDKHKTEETIWGPYLVRPENMKSFACRGKVCGGCADKNRCWYGYSLGDLKVVVPADAPSDEFYVTDLWVRCSNGSGKFLVCAEKQYEGEVTNGDISIQSNGVHLASITESQFEESAKATLMKPRGDKICVTANAQDTHLRIEFHRKNKALAASSVIYIEAEEVDASVESCMGVKDCLKELADGSDSAIALRNSNRKQYQCLLAADDDARNAISDKCPPWSQCLSQNPKNKKDLEVFLGAAVATPTAMVEGRVKVTREKESNCVDPSLDDPESFSCDCMEQMESQCGEVDEACFRDFMCKKSGICCSWKETHCPTADQCSSSQLLMTISSTGQADTMEGERASLEDRSKVTGNIDNSLDQTLSGKCSQ